MTADQRAKVDQMLGSAPAKLITRDEIPVTLLKGLQEHDGSAGRAVLVYPKPTAGLWQGPRNAAFVDALRAVADARRQRGAGRRAWPAGPR